MPFSFPKRIPLKFCLILLPFVVVNCDFAQAQNYDQVFLSKLHISGEGGVAFFDTGAHGQFPNNEFRVDEALTVYGYNVETVCDGEAAIRAVNNQSYDLIICDWKIPGISGQSIYERLRQMNPQALERFFFITGDILGENAEKFLRVEKKICLFKPFSIEQFRTTIQEVLHSHSDPSNLTTP